MAFGERKCEKCSGDKISRPAYDQYRDQLRFVCLTCGYTWHEPVASGGASKRWPGMKR